MPDKFLRIDGVRPGQPPTFIRVSSVLLMTEMSDGKRMLKLRDGEQFFVSADAKVSEVSEEDMLCHLIEREKHAH